MPTPARKQITENITASLTERRYVGNGLFMVRVISLSRSRSIIWLMVTEAPESKRPPVKTIARIDQFTCCEARTYPKAQENATRKDNRNLRSSQYARALASARDTPVSSLISPVIIPQRL